MSLQQIAVINGPNLNLLGTRKPEIYGPDTLETIVRNLESAAEKQGYSIWAYQSNGEGALVSAIQAASSESAGIIINAAGYAHTSIPIRDALEACPRPVIEVHLSNIYAREEFRRRSLVSEVAKGVICGFGSRGYTLALEVMLEMVKKS
jgi:3-dehydroquinate dehydratase-2